jgi:glyoxylate utilization-related uncharacterized protein
MKKREARRGKALVKDDKVEVLEYKTGYDEFRVFMIEIKSSGATTDLKFNSFSMAVVLGGNGEVEVEGFGRFNIEQYGVYYILPDKKLTISSTSEEPLVIYLANCDI